MEKSKLYLFPVSFLLLLGCVGCPDKTGNNAKLATPTIALNAEKTGVTWNAIEGAVSYSISVNDEAAQTVKTTSYDFELEAGEYDLKVVANASNKANNSDAANFSYSTLYASVGNLTLNNGIITWSSFVGLGLEYTVDDGAPVAIVGNSITASQSGVYTIRALPGYDEAANKYYIEKTSVLNKKAILVQQTQEAGVVLEDGEEDSNTDLQEKYEVKKYDNDQGWIDTTVAALLCEDNPFSTGKCIEAPIYYHGTWWKWTSDLEGVTGRIESLHFFLKANSGMRFAISFEITDDFYVSGMNLKNVYATYILQPAPQKWTEYTISTNDADWKVSYNGTLYPFAQVQGLLAMAGYTVQSIGDFFPYFGSYSIKAFGEYQSGGPTCRLWFDDIRLGVQPTQTIVDTKMAILGGQYAFKTNQISGGLFRYNPSGISKIEFCQGPNKEIIPVDVVVAADNHSMTITSDKNGFDVVATLNTEDGDTFTLGSATGSLAPFLTGLVADRCQALFDFEGYDSTGTGFDNNNSNPDSTFTGLRKDFYSDFYDDGSHGFAQSPVGGNGWSLMGSNDYLNLSNEYAHTGAKSMRLKYNKDAQMRFMTYNLFTGSGSAYEKGAYLSMWIRTSTQRDNDIKVKAFYIDTVTPADQNKCTETQVMVEATEEHEWVEVRLPLLSSKTYYGFAILPMKNNGAASGDGQYFYVDDIAIVNTVNPYHNA